MTLRRTPYRRRRREPTAPACPGWWAPRWARPGMAQPAPAAPPRHGQTAPALPCRWCLRRPWRCTRRPRMPAWPPRCAAAGRWGTASQAAGPPSRCAACATPSHLMCRRMLRWRPSWRWGAGCSACIACDAHGECCAACIASGPTKAASDLAATAGRWQLAMRRAGHQQAATRAAAEHPPRRLGLPACCAALQAADGGANGCGGGHHSHRPGRPLCHVRLLAPAATAHWIRFDSCQPACMRLSLSHAH